MPFVLRVGRKFVAWNSFGSNWYLSNRHHAEVFQYNPFGRDTSNRGKEALALYPTAKISWVKTKDY